MAFQPSPKIQIIGTSGAGFTCPADTSENILATVGMQAGAMGPNGMMRITTYWTFTNSANSKILQVRVGLTGGGVTGGIWGTATQTTTASMRVQVEIHNRGTSASQILMNGIGTGGWGTTVNAPATDTLNMAASTDIVFTGTKASAGETLKLEYYLIEVINP